MQHSNSRRYLASVYPGKITLFSSTGYQGGEKKQLAWRNLAGGGFERRMIDGHHLTILLEPHVQSLARELKACIEAVE
jgi:thioesterase domain-containing protein